MDLPRRPRSLRFRALEGAGRATVGYLGRVLGNLDPDSVDTALGTLRDRVESLVRDGEFEGWLEVLAEEVRRRALDRRTIRSMREILAGALGEDLTDGADARIVEVVRVVRELSESHAPGLFFMMTLPPSDSSRSPSEIIALDERANLRAAAAVGAMMTARGEARSMRALQAAASVVEGPYRRYLELLCRLKRVEEGRDDLDLFKSDVGNLATEAASRFPSCVDTDLARLRNAFAHSHFEYVPATDTTRWWNLQRKSGKTSAVTESTVEEMVGRVEDAFRVSTDAVRVIRRDAIIRAFAGARLDQRIPDLLVRWAKREVEWVDELRDVTRAFALVFFPQLNRSSRSG